MRALIIPPGGPAEVRDITPDIRILQELVGGYLEAYNAPGGAHAYGNEDANRLDLPPNPVATVFLSLPVRGAVVVLGADGPEEADVPEATLAAARELGILA